MRLSVNGFQLAYRTWGNRQSPTLVMMHSTSFGGWMWGEVAEQLAHDWYVIATDQRGHSDSGAPEDGYEMEQFADDLSGALNELGVHAIPALGHSSGSTTLLVCEARYPGTFSKLLLIEPILPPATGLIPTGRSNPMAEQARRRRATFDSPQAMYESFRDRPPFNNWTERALRLYSEEGTRRDRDGITLKTQPEYEARFYEAISRFDATKYFDSVRCPLVLVKGEDSDPMRMGMFEAARRALNAPVEVVEDAGHFVPQEQPAAVAALAREHLAQ
jgi:pimeloyl-ACP methyl ester carboxylesterase